jgi:hypothetical protein
MNFVIRLNIEIRSANIPMNLVMDYQGEDSILLKAVKDLEDSII